MESQEIRIDRLDKLIVVTLENQAAIIKLSHRIDARVSEHSTILEAHSTRLSNLEELAARIIEEALAIKELLAGPRGMGFTPEPADTAD